MENEEKNIPQSAGEPYVERPQWQVWLARIGLVLFVLLVIASYFLIARGGL